MGTALADNANNKLRYFVGLRLSADEKSSLSALAIQEQASESEVIRRLVRCAAGLPLPVAGGSKQELRSCSEQLRKAGVNLNQGVRAMNEGRVACSESMLVALQKLAAAVIELQKTIKQMQLQPRQRRAKND